MCGGRFGGFYYSMISSKNNQNVVFGYKKVAFVANAGHVIACGGWAAVSPVRAEIWEGTEGMYRL